MLQRSILGVESCVSAAVEYRLTANGLFTQEMAIKLNDPVKLPGKRGMRYRADRAGNSAAWLRASMALSAKTMAVSPS